MAVWKKIVFKLHPSALRYCNERPPSCFQISLTSVISFFSFGGANEKKEILNEKVVKNGRNKSTDRPELVKHNIGVCRAQNKERMRGLWKRFKVSNIQSKSETPVQKLCPFGNMQEKIFLRRGLFVRV